MTCKRILVLVIGLLVFSGCSRHVVLKPDETAGINSSDWTVKSEPTAETETTKPVK